MEMLLPKWNSFFGFIDTTVWQLVLIANLTKSKSPGRWASGHVQDWGMSSFHSLEWEDPSIMGDTIP